MKKHPPLRFFAPICLMAVVAFAQRPVLPQPPGTPKRPVTDEYGAIKVTDDYRWLENWDNPEVKQWSAAQNARTREYLDRLASRPAIKERLTQLISASSARYFNLQFRGGMPPDTGLSSPTSRTELSQRKWDPMILSIFFPARTLRAGNFCDYRYPNWNPRRRRSSLPRVRAPVLTRAAARRLKTSNPLLAAST